MRISSKLSVKCEASHKDYCKKWIFNACRLQIGRVGTYRQVLHLTIPVSRKLRDKVIRTNLSINTVNFFFHFNNLEREGHSRTRVVTSPTFLFYGRAIFK